MYRIDPGDFAPMVRIGISRIKLRLRNSVHRISIGTSRREQARGHNLAPKVPLQSSPGHAQPRLTGETLATRQFEAMSEPARDVNARAERMAEARGRKAASPPEVALIEEHPAVAIVTRPTGREPSVTVDRASLPRENLVPGELADVRQP